MSNILNSDKTLYLGKRRVRYIHPEDNLEMIKIVYLKQGKIIE